ncbi:unnamed protein product, partial [Iphiclides podalirius]
MGSVVLLSLHGSDYTDRGTPTHMEAPNALGNGGPEREPRNEIELTAGAIAHLPADKALYKSRPVLNS